MSCWQSTTTNYKFYSFGVCLPGMAASDASATKEGEACLGGWIDFVQPPSKQRAVWYSVPLDRTVHRWAWAKQGEPHRVISTVELMAVLLLIHLMASVGLRGRHCVLNFKGVIDNMGDAFALMKQYSKRTPQAYMHMEVAYECSRSGIIPQLSHFPRECNQWADDLSKGATEGWNPKNRWHPDMSAASFHVVFKLVEGQYNS